MSFTASEKLQKYVGHWVIGIAQASYPLLHHLHISKFSQLAEELPSRLLHLFPCGIGIHDAKAIGHGAATAQGYSQIVDRISAKIQAGALAFFQHPFHPQGKACLVPHVFRCGWDYHEISGGCEDEQSFSPLERINSSSE